MSASLTSAAFVVILVEGIFGAALFALLQWIIYEPFTLKHGTGVPETWLVPGNLAAAASTGVFIFARMTRPKICWIVPALGMVIY